MGVLHHVCEEHSWSSGKCKHEDQENIEGPNNYLNKDSKMLRMHSQMEGSLNLASDRNEFDPKQIATTIGMKESEEELLKGPSRFTGKQKMRTTCASFGAK